MTFQTRPPRPAGAAWGRAAAAAPAVAGVPPAAIIVPAASSAAIVQGSFRAGLNRPFMMITTLKKGLYIQPARDIRPEVKVMAHVESASRGFRTRPAQRQARLVRAALGRASRGPVMLRNTAGGMLAMGVIYGIGSLIGQVTG
jgi:hypothetical protein